MDYYVHFQKISRRKNDPSNKEMPLLVNPNNRFVKNYYQLVKPIKFCVFCGKQPHGKTREHIIPKWLIEFTGNRNRTIGVGPFISQSVFHGKESLEYRSLSYNEFVFPACDKCNQRFGEFEAKLKPIITKLIGCQQLSSHEFSLLLDWFDKIRIGLWLGFHQYLDENYWGILPHFYISDRLGKVDRALLIYRSDKVFNGIRLVGINTPAFAHVPSCFTLILNNLFIVNISSTSLFAKQAGFPFFEHLEFTENQELRGLLTCGTNTPRFPIYRFKNIQTGNVIAQIIYLLSDEHEYFSNYYGNDYVKNHTFQPSKSIPLIQRNNSVLFYPLSPSFNWIPNVIHEFNELINFNFVQTLKIQNSLVRRFSLDKSMSREVSRIIDTELSNCIKANNKFIELFGE